MLHSAEGSPGDTHTGRYACTWSRRGAVRPGTFARPASRSQGMGAREKYSAKPFLSKTTLTTFGIKGLFRAVDLLADRSHGDGGVVDQRRDGLIDHLRLDQGFISLHIDHDIAVQLPGDLGDAVRAGGVVG